MKLDGHGQAKILTPDEIHRLFSDGFQSERDRTLFSICLYTGCRISEALLLTPDDVAGDSITFRKANTKGKSATRQVPISPQLRSRLANYSCDKRYLFPGRHGLGHMSRGAADQILRKACDLVGLKGVSTHSFRRTALTKMHNEGIPLRVIQRISGHKTLQALQRYLEVGEEQVESAIAVLTF